MNINDFQDYLSQQKQISPYASYLESSFYQLDEQKQNFFLNEVARSDMDPKIMMGLAKPTDVLISIAILVVTILVIAQVTIKIYSKAILNYGTKMTLKDIIKVYKDKNN